MHPNLSFEQAPPIDVPVRFLLTAPWFGIAAGLLVAWSGELAIASRWTPQALAIVHLLVVGFLLQAMSGALFQFVPVAAGGNVWRPRLVAGILHPALALAACLLVAGLYAVDSWLLRLAAGLFLAAISFQVLVIGSALMRTPARGPTIAALRLALAGLAATVALGATLAEGLGGGHAWPIVGLTNVHAAWGLGGWVLMLVIGVSYFVVPMFQLTPPYPGAFATWAPRVLVVSLGLWSLQLVAPGVRWPIALALLVAAAYAGTTLWLQARRRRNVSDATFLFFRGAMLSLLAAVAVCAASLLSDLPMLTWWLGVLALGGTFVSLVSGMAYKIVPFLNWLHLQREAGIGGVVPNMREMISDSAQKTHLRLHFASIGLLLAAGIEPAAAMAGGLVFALANGVFAWNLIGAARRYRTFRDRVRAVGASPGS